MKGMWLRKVETDFLCTLIFFVKIHKNILQRINKGVQQGHMIMRRRASYMERNRIRIEQISHQNPCKNRDPSQLSRHFQLFLSKLLTYGFTGIFRNCFCTVSVTEMCFLFCTQTSRDLTLESSILFWICPYTKLIINTALSSSSHQPFVLFLLL